jgi:hypothetical protein
VEANLRVGGCCFRADLRDLVRDVGGEVPLRRRLRKQRWANEKRNGKEKRFHGDTIAEREKD